MPRIEYAPDGKHWQTIKNGSLGTLWNYFITNPQIRENLIICPQARVRLIGQKVIGTLAYDPKTREFQHLAAGIIGGGD